MRFLHTADWHLGRLFHNTSLLSDQDYILNQFLDVARDTKPDVVLIAGDIYDRAIPPPDAVRLLDDVLTRLVLGLGIPTILIAGNHDSPLRLQFGARLMRSLKLYVYGAPNSADTFIQMPDEHGFVCFYPLPYAEPNVLREHFQDETIVDPETGMTAWLTQVKQKHPPFARSVIVAHTFAQGGIASPDSERRLAAGAVETVNCALFQDFDYIALGHLHRPQKLLDGKIHYSGSLLKYSFAEHDHVKGVNLVEMDARGVCRIEQIPLCPKRDVHVIHGTLAELLQKPPREIARDAFVRVELDDAGALFDPMGQLRQVFPNAMELKRPDFINPDRPIVMATNVRANDPLSLFRDFFAQVTDETLTAEQAALFAEIAQALEQEQREANA